MPVLRSHFDIFSLPVCYPLDADELERRYREASRHWHPDRFSRAPTAERAQVLARATDLNQAYRTLKDDWRRAEYLLKLHGLDLGSEEAGQQPAMAAEFLGEVMELREELLAARQAQAAEPLSRLRADIEKRIAALAEQVGRLFASIDSAGPATADRTALGAIATPLLMCRYYRRFRDEIAAVDESRAESAALATALPTQ
jgi:molecular chaperone HscB